MGLICALLSDYVLAMRNYHSVAAIFRTVAVIALIPSAVLFGADRPPLRILFERSTRLPTTDLQGEIKPLLEAGKQPEAVERSVEHLLKLADYAMKHGAERPVLMISNMPTFCSELGQWRYFFKRWPIQEAIWKALPEAKDDAARLRRGILAHLLGHDDEALKTFREWLAKHPDSSVIATRLADILIQRDDGEAEAVRVLTPVTDTPDDYALATWATAMRMQRGARVSIHFARVTAALLDAMPVSAAWLGWAEEALRAVVEGQSDDEGRGMLPSLLADEKAVPAGEPLRVDREAAMEELLDAMRRHPRLAMSALPFLARKPYSRGEDITMLTDEAFASLKRGLEDAPRGSFSLWMRSPWLEEDLYYPETSTTMHCPTVAEMLIYSAWKKQDIKKLESEALPVLKRVLSKECYDVVQARAVLYFSAEEDFLEQAARWHTMRHSTTTPKQEMTLEHVRPITFVARLRGLKTAEQALLRDAVQIEVARGTVLDHLSWDAHATIGNWLPGRTPEEMRRVLPVVTALIREWRKYPSDGALAGCVLLLNGICIGLHDERTLRDTWSTLPPVAREIGRNAGRFALHWDDVTCSLSMATATQETRRPLETRLRLVTGLGRSEAVGDALREMPEVIRRARHVGVLTRAEVCDHASQLLHSMPLLSVLGNLVDGFNEIGDSNGALNLIRTALEDSPLSGNGWALLLCGSYAAEHGEKELARKCLSLLAPDVIQQTAGKSKTGQYSMEQGVGTLTSLCDRR